MLDTLYIETVEQADALLKPKRVEVLRQLAEPRTCTQIGQVLGDTPQAVYYHVKRLQAAGLVELGPSTGCAGSPRASTARWLTRSGSRPRSPAGSGSHAPERRCSGSASCSTSPRTCSATSPSWPPAPPTLPSFGIAGDIRLAPEDGAAFVAELQRAFGEVLERYGGGEGHAFRLALACYPKT